MPTYYVSLHAATKTIHAKLTDSPPAGAVKVGSFNHNGDDTLGHPQGHALYHHIRDIMYGKSSTGVTAFFPNNVTDLSGYKIQIEPVVKGIKIAVTPSTVEVKEGATETLVAEVKPTTAYEQTLTYESSDTDVATVSAAGVVTGVAVGEAVITISLKDSTVVAKVPVNVTTE